MPRVLAFAVAVSSAGCAQLAGIDDTNNQARGGNAAVVTRISIGQTIEASALDLTGLSAMYFVANPEAASGFDRVLAGDAGQGRWTADLRAPAPLELTLPDVPTPIPRLFSFPNRELAILFAALEHPNPTPAPDPAMLNLTVTLDAATTATDGFQIYTVGSWTRRVISATELPVGSAQIGPLAYAFSTSTSVSGRAQLDRLTARDAYLVLRYAGAALSGFAEAAAFDQTGNDTVTATMTAVAADKKLDAKVNPTRLTTRYASARPAVAGLAMSWSLTASPGYRLASSSGPVLHSGSLLPTDVGVTVNYGNPFTGRGWNTLLTFATSQSRTYTPPDTTTPVTLSAGMNQFLEPSALDQLTLPAGLPELISLDGKPLSTDGEVIAPPTRFVTVTFIAGSPVAGTPGDTLYNLQVFDLVTNAAGNGLEYRLVLGAASREPTFALPPELFQAGHRYTLRAITTLGGYPALDAADFTNRTLPLAQSYLDSAVILVKP